MNDDLPDRMPQRIEDWTKPPPQHATTKIPRVFSIWGTACYGISSISSITVLLAMGFTRWMPPWWFIMPVLLYTFVSAGFICMGRIDSNKDARLFMQALKKRSDENKRRMNLCLDYQMTSSHGQLAHSSTVQSKSSPCTTQRTRTTHSATPAMQRATRPRWPTY